MVSSKVNLHVTATVCVAVQVGRQEAYMLLLLPDCQLMCAVPPCPPLIENEWLPGSCRVLSKKPLKLQSAWFRSLLGLNLFCLLDGCWRGRSINTAHPPPSKPLHWKKKKKTSRERYFPLRQDKWQLQSATSKNHNFTVTMATKLERAQQGLLSKCELEKDKQRERTLSGESGRIMQLRTSFIPQPECVGADEHTHTYLHRLLVTWILPLVEIFSLLNYSFCDKSICV